MAKGFCIIEKEVELWGWEPSLEEKSLRRQTDEIKEEERRSLWVILHSPKIALEALTPDT